MKLLNVLAVGTVMFLSSPFASAAIDVSDAVSEFTDAAAPVAALGGAALVLTIIIKVYRKIRGAA